jgi:biotin synthase
VNVTFSSDTILTWLRTDDAAQLEQLWRSADETRHRVVGDAVHLRGLIEVSSHCVRNCAYCGLHAGNRAIERYRLTDAEVMGCVHEAVCYGYGTVVLQSGEDPGLTAARVAEWVARIKRETPLAVTLSLGERDDDELQLWRAAGADRYLLRFETSDPRLYERIHPNRPGRISDRLAVLRRLRAMGYEIGSGVMAGIPGQTYASLARDILLFQELDLDMIGVGPYIAHPGTALGQGVFPTAGSEQVPATETMVYKVLALTRLVRPDANIPSTTALATLNKANGRELGLARGANVVMPNLTPTRYRALYEIYPAKACISETADACRACLSGRIASIGRHVGIGPGGRATQGPRSADHLT